MKEINVEELMQKVNDSPRLSIFLRVVCYLCTLSCVFSFGYMLMHFILQSWIAVLGYCLILGVSLGLVSLMRKLINAPRPYEIYDFFKDLPKEKRGCSFPSRHSFSAFAIGTLCMFVNPLIGGITLTMGVAMCFCRVALGIHFIRDVLCGAIIGVVSSIIGVLILL